MGKGLKGFKRLQGLSDPMLKYVYLWMDDKDHQKLYEMLLKWKGEIEPLSYMRQMSLLTHSQN